MEDLPLRDQIGLHNRYIDGVVWVAADKKTGNPFSSDDSAEQSVRDLDSFYENPHHRRFKVPLVLGEMDKLKARRYRH